MQGSLPVLPHWVRVHLVALPVRVFFPIVEGLGIVVVTKQIVLL